MIPKEDQTRQEGQEPGRKWDKNSPGSKAAENENEDPDYDEDPILDEEDLEEFDIDEDEADDIEWEPGEDPGKE